MFFLKKIVDIKLNRGKPEWRMNKSNLILAGVVIAGLIVGVALGGYKDASTPAASA